MGVTEIVKALVSPAEKLIEAFKGAIGKAYEPRHTRKMADAKAYELEVIGNAIRNSDISIAYNSAGISIDTGDLEEIAKRASYRLAFQEITKQHNIEQVADIAYEELQNAEPISNDPINTDWMVRFFNSVEDISNEEMQKIWGHILAGEIKSPNSYSLRTLERLRNMTQQEAEHFQLVSSLAMKSGGTSFVLSNRDLLNKHNVSFAHILELEECGLMTAQELQLTVWANEDDYIFNDSFIGQIRGKNTEENNEVKLSIFAFTESGAQLLKVINPQANRQYFIDCLQFIRKQNRNFVVEAHDIKSFTENGDIIYDKNDILPPESSD